MPQHVKMNESRFFCGQLGTSSLSLPCQYGDFKAIPKALSGSARSGHFLEALWDTRMQSGPKPKSASLHFVYLVVETFHTKNIHKIPHNKAKGPRIRKPGDE